MVSEELAATSYEANFRDITFERLDGEVIAINLATGSYFSMSGPAADLFTLITSGHPMTKWWAELTKAFASPPDRRQCLIFLENLLELRLAQGVNQAAAVGSLSLPDDYARGEWTDPKIEEFDDLQDLILVDPIHDTSNLGWPNVENESD